MRDVTKLLQITLYPTVIMIQKGSIERKRARERVLNSKLMSHWHETQHVCFYIKQLLFIVQNRLTTAVAHSARVEGWEFESQPQQT